MEGILKKIKQKNSSIEANDKALSETIQFKKERCFK